MPAKSIASEPVRSVPAGLIERLPLYPLHV
jgi:hypothetical protein